HGITDGSLADFLKVPSGGTRVPINDDRCNHFLNLENPQELDRIFSELYLKNYQIVVRTSLEKSGYGLDDVKLLLTNQVKKSLAQQILTALGLREDQTLSTLSGYGHLGPMDTLLGLAKCVELGRIASGNIVVLASSAAGFSWAALTLQWLE
ncbi:MAG: beta-ketoacyl-ACP reductase, partial [Methylococcaceae bacterium]|nr:beta-ketoacyl-ACP reductase [Methylococcaceae bacterium]